MAKRMYQSPSVNFYIYDDEDILTASFGLKPDKEGNDDNDVDLFGGFVQ